MKMSGVGPMNGQDPLPSHSSRKCRRRACSSSKGRGFVELPPARPRGMPSKRNSGTNGAEAVLKSAMERRLLTPPVQRCPVQLATKFKAYRCVKVVHTADRIPVEIKWRWGAQAGKTSFIQHHAQKLQVHHYFSGRVSSRHVIVMTAPATWRQ